MGAGVGDGRNPSDRRLFAKGGKYAHSGGAKAGDQVDQVDGCRRGEGRVVGEYLAFSDDTVRQGGDFYFCERRVRCGSAAIVGPAVVAHIVARSANGVEERDVGRALVNGRRAGDELEAVDRRVEDGRVGVDIVTAKAGSQRKTRHQRIECGNSPGGVGRYGRGNDWGAFRGVGKILGGKDENFVVECFIVAGRVDHFHLDFVAAGIGEGSSPFN